MCLEPTWRLFRWRSRLAAPCKAFPYVRCAHARCTLQLAGIQAQSDGAEPQIVVGAGMQSYPWRALAGHMIASSWSASQPLSAESAVHGEHVASLESATEVRHAAVWCYTSQLLIEVRLPSSDCTHARIHVPGFILTQLAGACPAVLLVVLLVDPIPLATDHERDPHGFPNTSAE